MPRMADTAAARAPGACALAWALWAAAIGLACGFLALLAVDANASAEGARFFGSALADAVTILPVIGFSTVGAFVASRQPGNRVGWTFCWTGVIVATATFATEYAIHALFVRPGSLPAREWAAWLATWLFIPALFLQGVLLLLLFPDGRLLSRRWVVAVWLAAIGVGMLSIGLALKPGRFDDDPFGSVTNPAGSEHGRGVFDALAGTGWAPFVLSFLVAAVSLALRAMNPRHVLLWLRPTDGAR
jgi:two-component system NarL family sensor kinase